MTAATVRVVVDGLSTGWPDATIEAHRGPSLSRRWVNVWVESFTEPAHVLQFWALPERGDSVPTEGI